MVILIIRVVLILLFFFLVYNLLPNFYIRNLSKDVVHVLKKERKEIALTFDDGPDERYTNQVLDVLKKYHIKATFFVVANKAKKSERLIKRMQEEGHEIALHTLNHKSAWLMGPFETLREIPKALGILNELGVNVRYYRPPWGTFNLFTFISAKRNKLKTIFWSVEAYDWRKNNTPETIGEILLERVKDQSIIVLHDSGGAKGAPMNTIRALEKVIPIWLEQGFKFVPIKDENC